MQGEDRLVIPRDALLPGESLLTGAHRLLEVPGPVDLWAVDLSGDPLVFGYGAAGARPTFQPMTRADFPTVVRWQGLPHVERWWQREATDLAAAEASYGPAIDGEDPTRMWMAELGRGPIGFLQDYRIGDHPEYAILTAAPDAIGLDYAIGEPDLIGRGLGTRLVWTFLRDRVWPHYPGAAQYFAAPDHRNAASLRMLDKLGFTRGIWFDEPSFTGGVDTVVGCSLDVAAVFGLK